MDSELFRRGGRKCHRAPAMIDTIEYALTFLADERTWITAAQRTPSNPYPETRWRPRMMRKSQIAVALAMVVASAIAPDFAGTNRPSSPVTIRELAHELASVAEARAPEVSARISSFGLGRPSNTPLTEGEAVALLRTAGLAATTSDPGRLLSRDRADALVREFKASVANSPSKGGGSPHDNGVKLTDLDGCLGEANHGQCVNCCKEQGGGASACAKLCFEINKPSSSEPLP